MSSSCRVIVDDLARCLRESPCMKEQGRKFSDCLKAPEEDITSECKKMRNYDFECKVVKLIV